MQVNYSAGATAFVQVVYVLGDDGYPVALFQFGEQAMGAVWLGGGELAPAFVVEAQHQFLIAGEGFGGGNIVNTMLLPKPAVVAEGGEAALGADASAGEDYNMPLHQSKILPGLMMPFGSNTCLIPLR